MERAVDFLRRNSMWTSLNIRQGKLGETINQHFIFKGKVINI